jgi:PAS domain S-box-containing protein
VTSRILVVEDNRDLADNIRELFEEVGADVSVCHSANEARSVASKRPFDLAVVDVNLPGGESGIALVPELKASSPDADVVLVTGDATLGSAIEAVRQGVFAYVQKPFDPDDFLALADRALSQVALRRERAALSMELARSEALYHDVVDSVHSLLVGLDASHCVRMFNRRAAELSGFSEEEALGADARELLAPPEHRAAFEQAVEKASGVREVVLPLRVRSGTERIVRWRIVPLTGLSQASLLAVGEDVTEKIALEARAAQVEAMAAMGALTAGLAHEIRNPLNAAVLQLELLSRASRKLDDLKAREQLEMRSGIVRSELARLTLLLDEFLGLARPQHFAIEPIDPERLLRQVAAVEEPVAKQAGIDLVLALEEVPRVRGDEAKLKQVFVNLIVNAIDAMRDRGRGTIRLVASLAGSSVELRVEDDGPGLPALAQHELFRPFMTTKEKGTGLGLAIVKHIVEMHGGAIDLLPREGGGTIARVQLAPAP